jgi:hypothetical protein
MSGYGLIAVTIGIVGESIELLVTVSALVPYVAAARENPGTEEALDLPLLIDAFGGCDGDADDGVGS